jgi:hypothetical protein
MSFKLSVTKEDVAKGSTGGASFIGTSGIYDVSVLAVTVDENEHGSTQLGFYVDLGNDNKQMLYGALPLATYDNSQALEGNQKTFGAICTIADVPMDKDFEPVEAELPIGKGGAMKEVAILEDFEDLELKIWVKQDYYRKKDGSIGDQRVIKGAFRAEDNASGDEIINEGEYGSRFARQEKYFTDVGYRDVTEDEVKAMVEARRAGGSTPAKKAPAAAAKKSRFAK